MITISVTLGSFVLLGLIVRKYDFWTRFLLASIIIGVIAFLFLT